MGRRISAVMVVTCIALGLSVASSSAVTMCVYGPGQQCPANTDYYWVGNDGATLQAALTEAARTAEADTIYVGAGNYTGPAGFSYNSANPLTVIGAGADKTVLKGSDTVLHVANPSASPTPADIKFSALGVDTSAGSGNAAVSLTGATLEDVRVTSTGGSDNYGIFGGSAVLRRVTVALDPDVTTRSYGAFLGGSNTIEDSDIAGTKVGVWSQGSALTVHSSTFAGEVALWHHAGTGVITDSVLIARQPTASAVGLRVTDLPSANSLLTAVNLTVVNDSPGAGSGGIESAPQSGNSTSLYLYDSIVSGFPTQMRAAGASSLINGDFAAGSGARTATAGGSISGFAHSIVTDPTFVDAPHGDYRLRWGNPAIDFDTLGPYTPGTDRAGNPQPVGDATGDGYDDLDLGAYEYQRKPPVAAATVTPDDTSLGANVTFDAGGSTDPDGDQLTYSWSFDDGSTAVGSTVTRSFNTGGTHVATVTVTDATGLTDTAQTAVVIAVPLGNGPGTGGGDAGNGQGGGNGGDGQGGSAAGSGEDGGNGQGANGQGGNGQQGGKDPGVALACTKLKKGSKRADVLTGGPVGDILKGLAGNDRLNGGAGDDCLDGGPGDDKLNGAGGNDKLVGGPGRDKLVGGAGKDRLSGGPGADTINARDGVAETVNCGAGRDSARVDATDRVRACEQVSRPKS